MAGARSAAAVAAALRKHGEPMTLKRTGQADLAVSISASGATTTTVVNGQTRVTRTFRMSNEKIASEGWPGPPRAKDQIVDATGKTWIVQDCDTRSDSGVVLAHIMTVTG